MVAPSAYQLKERCLVDEELEVGRLTLIGVHMSIFSLAIFVLMGINFGWSMACWIVVGFFGFLILVAIGNN